MGAACSITPGVILPISVEDAHELYYKKNKDNSSCDHTYLYYMQDTDKFKCCDCNTEIHDNIRIEAEREIVAQTYDVLPDGTSPGAYSARHCGVKLGLLKALVEVYDCADWSAADVIRCIVKPATEMTRCRAAELPYLKNYVGHAQTFISYAQKAAFGGVVTGLLDGGVADLDRLVWIDIFGIRQWPSSDQEKQLDFANTIRNCSSFISICSAEDLDAFEHMKWVDYHLKQFKMAKSVRQKICFLRVWCLAESYECSVTKDMPYILKGGKHKKNMVTGELEYETNGSILEKLQYLVDIENSDATYEQDKRNILKMVEGKGGGIARLNSAIMGAISGAFSGTLLKGPSDYALPCAACGDLKAKEIVMRDPSSIFCTAANGFTKLLSEMISMGSFDMYEHDTEFGGTCLTWAAYGAHWETSKLLLDNCLPNLDKLEDYLNTTSHHGRSALMAASKYGHAEYMKFLIDYAVEKNVDLHINALDNDGLNAVMFCCIGGHSSALKVLLDAHADTNRTDKNRSTALMKAVSLGHPACVSLLLEYGADPVMMDSNGITAMTKKKVDDVDDKLYDDCIRRVRQHYKATTGDAQELMYVTTAVQALEGKARKTSVVYEYQEPTKMNRGREITRQNLLDKKINVLRHTVKNKNIDVKLLADPILNKRITRMQARMRGYIGRNAVKKLISALKFTNKSGNYAHRGSFHRSGVGARMMLESSSTNELQIMKSRIDKPRPKPLLY